MKSQSGATKVVRRKNVNTPEARLKHLLAAIRKHRREVWPLAKDLKDVGCEDDRKLYEALEGR